MEKRILNDDEISEMLGEGTDVDEDFRNCLTGLDGHLPMWNEDSPSMESLQVKTINECVDRNREASAKIGISKFTKIIPNEDQDVITWEVE